MITPEFAGSKNHKAISSCPPALDFGDADAPRSPNRLPHLALSLMEAPRLPRQLSCDDQHLRSLRQLGAEINKKVLDLATSIFRLDDSVSPKLLECFKQFQCLARSLPEHPDLIENHKEKLSYTFLRLSVLSKETEEELLHCVGRYSKDCLDTMDTTLLRQVFNTSSPSKEIMTFRVIHDLVTSLLVNGSTERRILDTGFGKECLLKCRYREGRVQILTKEFLGLGGMKVVKKVTILVGSVDLLGSVYAYAKPRKDSGKYTYDECLAFLCEEMETVKRLRMGGARNIVDVIPVFRQKAGHIVKGGAMKFFNNGDIASLIKSTQYPINRTEMIKRLEIAHGMAIALAGCHENGMLHGDFKPENVLLQQTDEGLVGCLCDLGCAIRIGKQSFEYNGSPLYLAPEQWLGVNGDWLATPGTDMWPFGLFLLSLIYGARENLISRHVTKEFMKLSPQKQYQDMCQLQRMLLARLSTDNAVRRLIGELLSLDPLARPSALETAACIEEAIAELQ
jgi:hypothetical protein